MLPSGDEARSLVRKALGFSRGDEARVILAGSRSGNVRFALSGITSCGDVEDLTLTVLSTVGTRRAGSGTNLLDDGGVEAAVRASEEMARLSPEDPEYVPEEGPKEIRDVGAYFEETASAGSEARARAAAAVLALASESGGVASGFYQTGESLTAVGTSRGFLAVHRETRGSFSTTVRTRDGSGSGWAGREENRISFLDPAAIARIAADKAVRSASSSLLEPGAYTVVLEPDAVADLMPFLLFSLDARMADEGRSFFSKSGGGNRIGERLFGEKITLVSDPADPMLLSIPFSNEAVPRTRKTWIQAGVLADLSYSRFWGMRQGGRTAGGIGSALLLGGDATLEQMIRGTERGLLVSRFHYVNMVDPRQILLTGLTRDGTFLIEKGKVRGPVKNLRFNQSLPEMLRGVEALGVPRRTLGSPVMAMPAMKVKSFTFTSVAEGV